MDAKAAREFYQDYVDTIYHAGRIEELGRFFAEDVVPHPAMPGLEPGLEGLRIMLAASLRAFSGMRFTLDSFVFQDDIIAPRVSIAATHVGDFMGIAATGRRIVVVSHPHYRLEHGKIVEFWDLPDTLSLLQQLGVLPPITPAT